MQSDNEIYLLVSMFNFVNILDLKTLKVVKVIRDDEGAVLDTFVSPCKRILLLKEKSRLSVIDVAFNRELFYQKGSDFDVQFFTTDLLIYRFEENFEDEEYAALNFIDNEKAFSL
jgi:hypothetical protein